MHVLVTADTLGGVWTYTRELVSGLVRRGVDVTLVSFGEVPEPRQLAWMEGLRRLSYRATGFKLEWMQDSADDIAASSDYLLGVIREVQPDVLHLNQFCYGALDVDLPKLVVAHSDVVSWWVAVHGEGPPPAPWIDWYRDTVQRGLDGATMVLAPSRWMLSQIEEHYGPMPESAVIHNGRSPQLFNPHAAKQNTILTVGRLWDPAKQVMLLAERNYGWPVVIAGGTEHPDQAYRSAPRQVVCAGTLEFTGRQTPEQLLSLFAGASIYVATSRYEPFGLAPLEAALSRCALVANDIPSLREVWGEAACYFRSNDAEGLRATIAALQTDRHKLRHYAELAYQRARRHFSADNMVDEYISLYLSLVTVGSVAA